MKLHARGVATGFQAPVMGRLTTAPIECNDAKAESIMLRKVAGPLMLASDAFGYAGVLSIGSIRGVPAPIETPSISGVPGLDYLGDGDVVLMLPNGVVNVLYRKSSRHNTILATERCNSLCLMCSQPPRDIDDSYRVVEILRLLELIDEGCLELGLSGGEPTLLGDDFIRIVEKCKNCLPSTGLHVLTNGRLFTKRAFAMTLGAVGHPDLVLGIPVYSDIDEQHDHVVQARGAFEETIQGLYHLAEANVRVEIRVVVHALTYQRLPQLAEFISRNLPFASHVALMGLEMFGFVHRNLPALWIDPAEYQSELAEAVRRLALGGMNVSVYNHQLCTVPRAIWPFTRRSISDWKNVYLDACTDCGVRDLCGGFFQSATKRHSAHISPLSRIAEPETSRLKALICG
jgi:His-Xaa-Ser system radical SAM maturase HxsC